MSSEACLLAFLTSDFALALGASPSARARGAVACGWPATGMRALRKSRRTASKRHSHEQSKMLMVHGILLLSRLAGTGQGTSPGLAGEFFLILGCALSQRGCKLLCRMKKARSRRSSESTSSIRHGICFGLALRRGPYCETPNRTTPREEQNDADED